jgi:hypothetical protein
VGVAGLDGGEEKGGGGEVGEREGGVKYDSEV